MSCPSTTQDANAIQAAKDTLNSITSTVNKFGSIVSGDKPVEVKIAVPQYAPPSYDKQENATEVLETTATALVDVERQLSGGTQILTYTHDLQVVVGGEFVSADVAPPVIAGCGDPVLSKVSITDKRTHFEQKATPFIQSVTHPIPWGNYNVVASHKYNVMVGVGGIFMHTDGCIDINSGGRTNISSLYELNLTSAQGNTNIISGNHLQLQGDTVNIKSNDQVVVDSNLGVSKNLTVHGGVYVDGEVYCHSITGPAVVRETQQVPGNALLPPNTVIGYVDMFPLFMYIAAALIPHGVPPPPPDVFKLAVCTFHNTGGVPGSVVPYPGLALMGTSPTPHFNDSTSKHCHVLPHSHTFYTINTQLHSSNESIRKVAAADVGIGSVSVAKEQSMGGSGLVT